MINRINCPICGNEVKSLADLEKLGNIRRSIKRLDETIVKTDIHIEKIRDNIKRRRDR